MTHTEYARLARWFHDYTRGFAGEDGVLAPAYELKRSHSVRVAENARWIGQALGLTVTELELATAAGLLHDIGRFTQYSRFGSFRDSQTIDHGEEGFRVLTEAAAGLFATEDEREQVLCAVRYHNRKVEDLPPGLAPSHDRLLRLVRDADKIDIIELVLEAVAEDGFKALPAMLPDIRLVRDLTPAVLAMAMKRQALSTTVLRTLGDFLLQLSTWFSELNYEPSRALATTKNLMTRLRRELPATREIDRILEGALEVGSASP